jgi:transposase
MCQTGSVTTQSKSNEESIMQTIRIGIDLAKQVFQIHGVDERGGITIRRQLRRNQVAEFFQQLPPCLVGMEACAGAHFWARTLQAMGHTVRVIAPQFVKPYVKGNKNDANDAEAICEAVGRPSMRFVALKTVEQQEIQALHRVRTELVRQRTAKGNQIRGLLGEFGIVASLSIAHLRRALSEILAGANEAIGPSFRTLLSGLQDDLLYLERRVEALDRSMRQLAQSHPLAIRLQQLHGVGPVIATALIASLGDGRMFKRGRDAAAWVGLVPRQHSSGGKDRLLGISKRGDSDLRSLLIHGARSVIYAARKKDDHLSLWIHDLCARRNNNIAAVALANKTMRLAWALLTSGQDYDPNYQSAIAA